MMSGSNLIPWAVLAVMVSALAACGQPTQSQTEPTLNDLQSIEEFQALFDTDVGVPRLVLIVSPT